MTRRETLRLLGAVPLLGLSVREIREMFRAKPAALALHWDWHQGSGGPIDYFEVLVTSGDTAAAEHSGVVTRVPGEARACQLSLPDGGVHGYHVRVRAVNAQGSSGLSAPVILPSSARRA